MKPLSKVIEALPVSGIRQLMDLAAGRAGVIHLEVGEPDANTPAPIIEAAHRAAVAGFTRYTPNAGIRTLREGIARKLAADHGLDVPFDQVVVTTGAMGAISSALLAVIDPGDEVLIPDPGWPNYRAAIILAGGVPVAYPLSRAAGYLPDPAAIGRLVTPRTKLVVFNAPGNPTGAVYPPALAEALVRLAAQHDLYALSDEVYEAYVYDGTHVPLARFDQDGRVITVLAFSKTYAMTGWRLGYAVASKPVAAAIGRIQSPLISCSSAVAQTAAEAALELPASAIAAQREVYRRRRDRVIGLLEPEGLLAARPAGAFYALVDLGAVSRDSNSLARDLLMTEGVATAPGGTFGREAEGLLRISFAASDEDIAEGCRRIIRFRDRHAGNGPQPQ